MSTLTAFLDSFSGVLQGIAANAITEILMYTGGRRGASEDRNKVQIHLAHDEEFIAILQRGARSFVESTRQFSTPAIMRVKQFLESDEAKHVFARQFADAIDGTSSSSRNDLRRAFTESLVYNVLEPSQEFRIAADELFDAIASACGLGVEGLAQEDVINVAELRASRRFRLLVNQIGSLSRKADFLASDNCPTHDEVGTFVEQYRSEARDFFSSVSPPHLDAQSRVPIDSIYVAPTFRISREQEWFEEPDSIPLGSVSRITHSYLCANIDRTIILGTPGAGKSTFARKLAFDRADEASRLLPIVVALRNYGSWRLREKVSIRDYIQQSCTLQVPATVGIFEYLLLSGRLMLIFDGLDELIDSALRREVRDDVESFCRVYPACPVLVTSREVGYEQAPLDPSEFFIARIEELRDNQIREYVNKWFGLDSRLSNSERVRLTEAFSNESASVSDLCASPLILALMCALYKGDGYIPRNRPDLYEKCATLLFEKWDRSRGIYVILPFEAHVRPTIHFLADRMYGTRAYQQGISARQLVDLATEYLYPRRFEDEDEARTASRAFVDWCRGRAWVFTDIGSQASGEPLYQFTHRTFLEYFAASYLTRVNATPDNMVNAILPWILKRESDVVAQLACQIVSKHFEDGADTIINCLLALAKERNSQAQAFILSFVLRSLAFMVPSAPVVRECAELAIHHCLEVASSPKNAAVDLQEILGALGAVRDESRQNIRRGIISALYQQVDNSPEEGARAIELAVASAIWLSKSDDVHSEATWLAKEMRKPLGEVAATQYEQMAPCSLAVATQGWLNGAVTIFDIVRGYGVDGVFMSPYLKVCGEFGVPIEWYVITKWLRAGAATESTTWKKYNDALEQLAEILAKPSVVHVSAFGRIDKQPRDGLGGYLARHMKRIGRVTDSSTITKEALLGSILILAIEIEVYGKSRQYWRMLAQDECSPVQWKLALKLMLQREKPLSNSRQGIEELNLPRKGRGILAEWLNGEVSFVSTAKRNRPVPQ